MSHASTALAAAGLVALAGVAGWAIVSSAEREPDGYTPQQPLRERQIDTATPPILRSTDPRPESGLWCSFAGDVPICDEGMTACERRRGASSAASSPCERTTPSCFISRGKDGDTRVCTPTIDGCEQIRTGPLAAGTAITGCLPASDDVVVDEHNLLMGLAPPEWWCVGGDCAASKEQCSELRDQLKRRAACARQPVYCFGDAPFALTDCRSTARECERLRRNRKSAARCRLMP